MVYVPAGDFLMGSEDADAVAPGDEKPLHRVYLNDYWIYKDDVTVAQYKSYCAATGAAMPDQGSDAKEELSGSERQFGGCTRIRALGWRKATDGSAMEKAARGTDGRVFPWGDNWALTAAITG